MANRLAREFCEAVEKWAQLTTADPSNITTFAMSFLGAPWHVRRKGAVDDPYAPEHRGKTYGEITGHYTVKQLEGYLVRLTDEHMIYPDVLIVGLANAVERMLKHLAVGYEAGQENMRREIAHYQDILDNPENHAEFLETYQRRLEEHPRFQDGAVDALESIRHIKEGFERMLLEARPDEQDQRQRLWDAWKEVMVPVIAEDNLEAASREFTEGITGRPLSRST